MVGKKERIESDSGSKKNWRWWWVKKNWRWWWVKEGDVLTLNSSILPLTPLCPAGQGAEKVVGKKWCKNWVRTRRRVNRSTWCIPATLSPPFLTFIWEAEYNLETLSLCPSAIHFRWKGLWCEIALSMCTSADRFIFHATLFWQIGGLKKRNPFFSSEKTQFQLQRTVE